VDQPKRIFSRGLKLLEPEPEALLPLKFTNLNLSPETIRPVFFEAQVHTLRFLFLRGVNFDIILSITA
jgi:hypothetical protein